MPRPRALGNKVVRIIDDHQILLRGVRKSTHDAIDAFVSGDRDNAIVIVNTIARDIHRLYESNTALISGDFQTAEDWTNPFVQPEET